MTNETLNLADYVGGDTFDCDSTLQMRSSIDASGNLEFDLPVAFNQQATTWIVDVIKSLPHVWDVVEGGRIKPTGGEQVVINMARRAFKVIMSSDAPPDYAEDVRRKLSRETDSIAIGMQAAVMQEIY